MFEDENGPNTIVCKLKFGDIAIFIRFWHLENTFSHIICKLEFDLISNFERFIVLIEINLNFLQL